MTLTHAPGGAALGVPPADRQVSPAKWSPVPLLNGTASVPANQIAGNIANDAVSIAAHRMPIGVIPHKVEN